MHSIKLWPVASHFGGVAGSSGGIVRFRGVSLGAEAVSGTNAVADPDVEAATRADPNVEGEAEAEAEAETNGGAPPLGLAAARAGANDEQAPV